MFLSENYFQHAEHFIRVLEEKDAFEAVPPQQATAVHPSRPLELPRSSPSRARAHTPPVPPHTSWPVPRAPGQT